MEIRSVDELLDAALSGAGNSAPSADFSDIVLQEFGALESKLHFEVGGRADRWVRYESSDLVVEVSQGRLSYEIVVLLGKAAGEGDARSRGSLISLLDLLDVVRQGESEQKFKASSSPDAIRRILRSYAGETVMVLETIRVSPVDLLKSASAEIAKANQLYWEEFLARDLRERAEVAWNVRDYSAVAATYNQLEKDLSLIKLRPSERARLLYAMKHNKD